MASGDSASALSALEALKERTCSVYGFNVGTQTFLLPTFSGKILAQSRHTLH